MIVTFLLVSLLFHVALTYPTGAASSACNSMTPFHRFSPQTVLPPFAINVSSTSYGPGDKIDVTLYAPCGRTQFKGFMLQARGVNDDPEVISREGTFDTSSGSHYVSKCGTKGQAVTHDINTLKTSMQFEWSAPELTRGHIVMTATIVQNINTFWVKILSPVIADRSMASDNITDDKNYPTATYDCSVFDKPSVRDSDCGSDKNCFANCNVFFCDASVTWKTVPEANELLFDVSVVVDKGDNQWISIGFSEDKQAMNYSMIECTSYENETKVYAALSGITNDSYSRLQNQTEVITKTNVSLENEIFRCLFRRPYIVTDGQTTLDLSKNLYIIISRGRTVNDSDAREPSHVDPIITQTPFQFWKETVVTKTTAQKPEGQTTTPRSLASRFHEDVRTVGIAVYIGWACAIHFIRT